MPVFTVIIIIIILSRIKQEVHTVFKNPQMKIYVKQCTKGIKHKRHSKLKSIHRVVLKLRHIKCLIRPHLS